MKVTIIYDTIYYGDDDAKVNFVNVQTIIFGDEVRHFVQNTKAVNYRYRGFDTLDDVYDFVRYESMQEQDLNEFAFKHHMAFHTEHDMCKWINDMCYDGGDLQEIFVR